MHEEAGRVSVLDRFDPCSGPDENPEKAGENGGMPEAWATGEAKRDVHDLE